MPLLYFLLLRNLLRNSKHSHYAGFNNKIRCFWLKQMYKHQPKLVLTTVNIIKLLELPLLVVKDFIIVNNNRY